MSRRDLAACVVGFIAGAAALAGGGDEQRLRAELESLQGEAARLAREQPPRVREPRPAADRELAIFPVGDLLDYGVEPVPPRFRSAPGPGGSRFGGIEEETPGPDLGREALDELVYCGAEIFAEESNRILPHHLSLITLAPPATQRRVADFLDRGLRPLAHRDVVVDLEIRNAPAGPHRAATVEDLREGPPLLALRGAGSLRSRFYVWGGAQAALLPDVDVEMASRATAADPTIEVRPTGVLLVVRAAAIEGSRDLRVDLELHTSRLEEIRAGATAQAGVLDLPALLRRDAAMVLRAPTGRWVVATRGGAAPEGGFVALVRARLVERGARR